MRFAYNTNGAANHRLDDALSLIADAGYDGVALTLDIHHLDPFADDFPAERRRVAARMRQLGLGCVVETGARFLLDPRAKHEPTLVTADAAGRARRVEFLSRALEVAAETGADAMSFWAGVPKPGVDAAQARGWLIEGVEQVVRRAEQLGTVAALEPEPGMLVETADDWAALGIPGLRLALDTGHCLVTGERDPAEAVRHFADVLGTVSIEDMRRGVHVHLPFGQGDMDIPGILAALDGIGFDRLVCVELSRESHRADVGVPEALAYLRGHGGVRRTALVLSPHLDDAAFSCGGLMACLADAGWDLCMVTAFTRSVPNPAGFALACQLDKGLGPDVDYMALRRAEDAEAAEVLGVKDLRWLDLPEAPHRGYGSAAALFGPVLPGDEVWRDLVPMLADLCTEFDPGLVLAPQGLGDHVDHRQMIRAVLASLADAPLAFYRDTPYAIRNPTALRNVTIPAMMEAVVAVGAGLERKVQASCAYTSQVGFQFGGPAAAGAALRTFAMAEGSGVAAERFLGTVPHLPED